MQKTNLKIFISILILSILFTSCQSNIDISFLNPQKIEENNQLVKFKSNTEYEKYIQKLQSSTAYYNTRGFQNDIVFSEDGGFDMMIDMAMPKTNEMTVGREITPSRYSETNVQVHNIDEPDIVKTDGKNIFMSLKQMYYSYYYTPRQTNNTKIINTLPVDKMDIQSEIDLSGELLLYEDILLILDNTYNKNKIIAYSVENINNPKKNWEIKLDNTNILTARMYQDDLYIITQKFSKINTCPIPLLEIDGEIYNVECNNIYHSQKELDNPALFSILKINIKNGNINNQNSFLGSSYNTNFYMSTNNLYLTFTYNNDLSFLINDFFKKQNIREKLSTNTLNQINKILTYDISTHSKIYEIERVLNQEFLTLDRDDLVTLQTDFKNTFTNLVDENKRNIDKTTIAKFNIEDLQLIATTDVSGVLLNQFSLDEYEGNLRIATNSEGNLYYGSLFYANTTSINDVYILDAKLNTIGSIKDLGETERIYSVRFIADKGYVVTFRIIDPFYVLDLSNPTNPKKEGELKIPGYSSYLHPLKDDIILGVGKENFNVKLSLFDVSNPKDPKEISKYMVDAYHTDILFNHRAFLQDTKHNIFVIPSYEKCYIFSYKNNELTFIKAIDQKNIQRSLYVNDYLYLISDENIIVLDQNTWKKVGELEFENNTNYNEDDWFYPMPYEPILR